MLILRPASDTELSVVKVLDIYIYGYTPRWKENDWNIVPPHAVWIKMARIVDYTIDVPIKKFEQKGTQGFMARAG